MVGYPALRVAAHEVRGPAEGGPCAGGSLIAATRWDGRVVDRRNSYGSYPRYFAGRYVWYASRCSWVWEEEAHGVQQGSRAA